MRKIRVWMVVAVLAVATLVPGVARAQDGAPAWGAGAVAARLIGWIEGLWSAVAGAETDPVKPADGGETLGVAPGGPVVGPTSDDPSTETKLYPELDPDG